MAFENFADFLLLTREEKLDMSEVVRTDCMQQNYTYAELIRGKSLEKLSQGGTSLKMFLRVSTNGSYQSYAPGDDFTPNAGDGLQPISVAWKFNKVGFGWYDEENLLNKFGVSSFADVLDVYEGGMVLDFISGIENDLWAVPSTADMESSTGNKPYSIPCFINEFTNTIPTGFTTVMTLSPATYTNWQNKLAGYSAANLLNPTAANGLAAALDDAIIQVQYRKVPQPGSEKYQADSTTGRVLLLTNRDGVNKYRALLRNMNDRTIKSADIHYGDIQFADNDVIWIPKLDTAAIYSGVGLAASHTAGVANSGYPRFYGINTDDLHPILNKHMFMERMKLETGGIHKPNYNQQYVRSAWNLACKSRRTSFLVYPNAA